MKHVSIISLICLLTSWLSVTAQSPQSRNAKDGFERFKAEKNAFITEFAQLTPEEAGKVFPLYDELQAQRFTLNREIRNGVRTKAGRDKKPTEEECAWAVDQLLSIPDKEATLDKEFYYKLKTILSSAKILKFKLAEERFTRHMMQKMGQRDSEKKEKIRK